MLIQINHLKKVKDCWAPSFHPPVDAKKAASLQKQIDSLQSQVNQAVAKQAQQVACTLARRNLQITDANAQGLGANPYRILGGEDFRRTRPSPSTSTTRCSPGTSRGTCSTSTAACIRPTTLRPLPLLPAKTTEPAICLMPTQVSYYRYEDEVPNGCGDGFPPATKSWTWG